MNLTKQKTILLSNLGEDAVKLLKSTKAIIAGGAITSIFSSTEVHDYDIYFRSEKDIVAFVRNTYNKEGDESDLHSLSGDEYLNFEYYKFVCVNQTNKSITYIHNGLKLQLIHFNYFESSEQIFSSYDFHINMGAYDFVSEEFVFHDFFLTSVAARRLTFNTGTRYPIMSSLRVSKYLERGYVISKKEMFKIGLAIANLNIDSWDTLEDQLSGFYGIDVTDIFDHSVPYNIYDAMNMLDNINEKIHNNYSSPTFDQVLFNIVGNPYKDTKIFYKKISQNEDGTYSNFYDSRELYPFNEEFDVKNLEVETDLELIMPTHQITTYWNRNLKIGVFVLQDEAHKMNMGFSGLELTGKIKLVLVKDIN